MIHVACEMVAGTAHVADTDEIADMGRQLTECVPYGLS